MKMYKIKIYKSKILTLNEKKNLKNRFHIKLKIILKEVLRFLSRLLWSLQNLT